MSNSTYRKTRNLDFLREQFERQVRRGLLDEREADLVMCDAEGADNPALEDVIRSEDAHGHGLRTHRYYQ
jgi:hypothetical protein